MPVNTAPATTVGVSVSHITCFVCFDLCLCAVFKIQCSDIGRLIWIQEKQ